MATQVDLGDLAVHGESIYNDRVHNMGGFASYSSGRVLPPFQLNYIDKGLGLVVEVNPNLSHIHIFCLPSAFGRSCFSGIIFGDILFLVQFVVFAGAS